MFIAPAEVQDQKLKGRLRGYNRVAVENLLRDVVSSYEQVWRERDQLRARVEQLEKELAPLRDAQNHLTVSLVTAERAASEVRAQAAIDAEALLEQAKAKLKAQENAVSEVRAQATRDAEALLEQARAKGKASQSALKAQQTRLKNEIERLQAVEEDLRAGLRAFLRSGMQLVEDRKSTHPTPVSAVPPSAIESNDTQKTPASTQKTAAATTQKTPAVAEHEMPEPTKQKTPDPATA